MTKSYLDLHRIKKAREFQKLFSRKLFEFFLLLQFGFLFGEEAKPHALTHPLSLSLFLSLTTKVCKKKKKRNIIISNLISFVCARLLRVRKTHFDKKNLQTQNRTVSCEGLIRRLSKIAAIVSFRFVINPK